MRAQSIRQSVEEHVKEGLEKPDSPGAADDQSKTAKKPAPRRKQTAQGKRQRKAEAKVGAQGRPSASRKGTRTEVSWAPSSAAAQQEQERQGEKRPLRVLGKNLRIDFEAGAGFRGWYPAQFPTVSIDHAGYFTWSVDVQARIFRWIRVHRGYYESTGLAGPRTHAADVAAQVGKVLPRAAWLLGAVGVPVSRSWETLVRYETRSFVTRARPRLPVAIAARDVGADTDLSDLPRSSEALRFSSGFETLVLGIRYYPERMERGTDASGGRIPPQYLGVGFTQYVKPYQVHNGVSALEDVLFNARFRGAGLAYGLTTQRGIELVYGDVDLQLGVGEVTLLDDLTLNETLPDDWLIGYLQGAGKLGCTWALTKSAPTLLLTAEASVGGATFFYWHLNRSGEQPTGQDDAASTPETQRARLPLNWDFLWSARALLTLPL